MGRRPPGICILWAWLLGLSEQNRVGMTAIETVRLSDGLPCGTISKMRAASWLQRMAMKMSLFSRDHSLVFSFCQLVFLVADNQTRALLAREENEVAPRIGFGVAAMKALESWQRITN